METIIIGAGMSGLRAATLLRRAGHRVTVVDKGRRYGGRMATRRVDDAVFDTGVLDLAAHSRSLRSSLEGWAAAGAAEIASQDVRRPRWRGAPMMRSLPTAMGEAVADGSTDGVPAVVRLATTVTQLCVIDGRWRVSVRADDRVEVLTADALLLTAPAPQSLALLRGSDGLAGDATLSRLEAVTYVPSLTVLVRPLDRAVTVAELLRPQQDPTDFTGHDLVRLHHNERTGASPVVALTLQASAAFSAAHLDGDRAAAAAALADEASGAVGVDLEVVHVHGWRFAQVADGIDMPALRDDAAGVPLVLGGDLFDPADDFPEDLRPEGVERAFLSGGAAAQLLLAG